MSEDEAVERLKACKDIADYLLQGHSVNDLSIEQLEQLRLVEDVFDAGIEPDHVMMDKAGFNYDQFNVLIPSARIASYTKAIKQRGDKD